MKKRNWKEIIVIAFCAIGIIAFSSQAITNVKGLFNKNEEETPTDSEETALVQVIDETV